MKEHPENPEVTIEVTESDYDIKTTEKNA